jgi:hypothetical protein
MTEIISVCEKIINQSLKSDVRDFDDAIQNYCALTILTNLKTPASTQRTGMVSQVCGDFPEIMAAPLGCHLFQDLLPSCSTKTHNHEMQINPLVSSISVCQ